MELSLLQVTHLKRPIIAAMLMRALRRELDEKKLSLRNIGPQHRRLRNWLVATPQSFTVAKIMKSYYYPILLQMAKKNYSKHQRDLVAPTSPPTSP